MLRSLSPGRRRSVLAAVLLAAALVVAVGTAAGLGLLDRAETVPRSRLGPVVVVPGYGGGTDDLAPLLAAVEEEGREVVVVPTVDGNTGDLGAQAQRLGATVEEVLDRTGAASVDVVGYSAGGVVARLWVRDHGGSRQARRVLTLGSPHHGTELAALGAVIGCPVACEQLAPDSALLARLNAGDETPDGPDWATVWSTEDQTVVPPRSAALKGALDFTVQALCPEATTSHSELPGHPVVLATLQSVLGAGAPGIPSGVSCAG